MLPYSNISVVTETYYSDRGHGTAVFFSLSNISLVFIYRHICQINMAIHLHIDHDSHKEKESVLHLMPCKICADEPANVSSYFNPYIRKINDEYYSSSFRGYLLQGKKVNIPSGYKGVTFSEEKQDDTKNVERNFYSTGMFSQFTYWNYDKIPSENDALVAAFDWIDIAEALHSTNT